MILCGALSSDVNSDVFQALLGFTGQLALQARVCNIPLLRGCDVLVDLAAPL